MSEDTLKPIFEASVAAGDDKNAVIMALINEGGCTVVTAVREYNRLARETGMTMTKEQKEDKIEEILSEAVLDTKEGVEEAKEALIDAMDVAPTTAMNYIKAHAKENDIELPIGQRKSIASKQDVVTFLVDNRGNKKAELSKGLMDEFGYAKGTADTITSMIGYMEEYAEQMNEG